MGDEQGLRERVANCSHEPGNETKLPLVSLHSHGDWGCEQGERAASNESYSLMRTGVRSSEIHSFVRPGIGCILNLRATCLPEQASKHSKTARAYAVTGKGL